MSHPSANSSVVVLLDEGEAPVGHGSAGAPARSGVAPGGDW
jgi:hypothetical protein